MQRLLRAAVDALVGVFVAHDAQRIDVDTPRDAPFEYSAAVAFLFENADAAGKELGDVSVQVHCVLRRCVANTNLISCLPQTAVMPAKAGIQTDSRQAP
jgi:hypothetical protein